MRGWSHEQEIEAFPGVPGAGRPNDLRSSRGVWIALGGDQFDRGQGGPTAETLRKGVRQSEQDQGIREGLSGDERERLKALERENREITRANDILRQVSAYFAQAELDRRRK